MIRVLTKHPCHTNVLAYLSVVGRGRTAYLRVAKTSAKTMKDAIQQPDEYLGVVEGAALRRLAKALGTAMATRKRKKGG